MIEQEGRFPYKTFVSTSHDFSADHVHLFPMMPLFNTFARDEIELLRKLIIKEEAIATRRSLLANDYFMVTLHLPGDVDYR